MQRAAELFVGINRKNPIVRGAFGKVFNVLSLGQIKGVNKYVEETGGEVIGADKKEVDAKLGSVIDRLRARLGLPDGLAAAGVSDDDIDAIAQIAPQNYLVQGNVRRSSPEEIQALLASAR